MREHPLLRTASKVAVNEGPWAAQRLLLQSGMLHLPVTITACLTTLVLRQQANFWVGTWLSSTWLWLLVVAAIMATAPWAARIRGLSWFFLLLVPLSCAMLWASLDETLAMGAGVLCAFSIFVAEILAILFHALRRSKAADAASLLTPAVLSTLAVIFYEGTDAFGQTIEPWGAVAGCLVATSFIGLFRFAEGALAFRHGLKQYSLAALSRWTEGMRSIWLIVVEGSSSTVKQES